MKVGNSVELSYAHHLKDLAHTVDEKKPILKFLPQLEEHSECALL